MTTNLFRLTNVVKTSLNLNRIGALLMSLVLLFSLAIGNAWASTSKTYYAKMTVAANPTGGGTVYVGSSGNTSQTSSGSSTGSSTSVSFNIYATANTGYKFKSWSGSGITFGSATTANTTGSISTSNQTSPGESKTATATFVKVFQFKAKADFTTGSASGGKVWVSFTNTTPSYQTTAMTATTTQDGDDANTSSKTKTAYFNAQAPTGMEFKGWYSDAAGNTLVSSSASYSKDITSSVIAEPSTPQLTYYAKFEKVETTPSWALSGIAGTSKTLEIGEEITLVTNTAGTSYSWGTPTYVDAGETNPVMTYDPSTKKFTANRAGTVTVTFTQAAGEVDGVLWKDGSQTFTFTVNKCTPTFAWADPLPNFVVGTSLPVSDLFSFTPAESAQNWTLTSSNTTSIPSITSSTTPTQLALLKEASGVTLTFHQDATWKWKEIANTSITINVTKEPVVFNWKNPALIAGNTYSWTDFVETNSVGAWNLVSEDESVIPTMRSIASTSGTVAAGTVTLTFTQGQDLGHDAVPVQTKTFRVYPADGLATFKVGSTTYADLNAANSAASSGSNKTIVVARDGVLLPGNYTISSGVTLYVPYSTSETSQTTPNVVTTTTALSAYRTLTFTDGANITCESNGVICVGGQMRSGSGGSATAYPTGAQGVMDMSQGGSIVLNNKATLYAWGYIKGQGMDQGNNTVGVGTITAKSGSIVWEDISFGDFRGGTVCSVLDGTSGHRCFPFQSYAIQNIEVPLIMQYGATEKVYTNVYASSQTNGANTTLIASSGAMFLLTDAQSVVKKWYDPTTDLMCYELSGTAQLSSLTVDVSVASVNSESYDLPITSSMHIILSNCTMILSKPMYLQPGAVVEIKPSATVNLTSNLFVVDNDEWGKFILGLYFKPFDNLTIHKNRGDGTSKALLDDAKLIVDGTLNVTGSLYTSTGGADIMGNGGGKITFSTLPSSYNLRQLENSAGGNSSSYDETKHYNGVFGIGAGDVYFRFVPTAAANLHNEDGSYTKSIASKTFHNVHGRWFVADDKDPKADHTYSFKYLDNGNAGTTATTPAVYSSDKTGLMGGYKWVNVSLDNSFCNNATYLGIDGHYYYYNSASTDPVSKWVQLVKLNDALYSGSDNNLYTFTTNSCMWASVGEIDENCMYTVENKKVALVGTQFVELEKDEYDEVYVKVTDHSDYYMAFDGCVWQHATKIPDTYKAYEVLDNPYIWLNDEWTQVAEEYGYYYTTDEQNVHHYYEFDDVTFTWKPAKARVRITTPSGDRKDVITWDMAMAYLGQYTNPTVTLLDDAIATQQVTTLAPGNKSTEFTFDFNGHTITANIGDKAYFMNMNTTATLYITDSSNKGNGQMLIYTAGNKKIEGIIVTKGKIVMNGGRIYLENAAVYASNTSCQAWTISLRAGQSMEMNGGEVEAKGHRNAVGLYLASSATTATTSKITIDGNAIVKATAPVYAYGVYTYGTVNVNGGTIEAMTEKVTSAGGSTNGANLAYGIYANVSSNATASNCYYATVNVTDGLINATAATSSAYGIYANAGQTVAGANSYNAYTNKASAKLNITGGTINAKCLTSTTAYGVYAFGTENSNGSNASGPHIIKNCKITASATGTAYGVGMAASVHSLCGIALTGVAEIENADIYAETTSSSTAVAVFANATNAFMSRAKYNNGTTDVSAANKKLWFIDANNNDGDLTHEAIAVSGDGAQKTYRCKIGATGAGGHITIKSGTFKAKSAYQYAHGAYAARSICNYDGTKGNGEITIIDGTFSVETANDQAYVLRNDGIMNVQGGTFNALAGTSTAYGVYSDAGVTTIDGGTFNIDATTTTAYGVCATGVIEGNTGWKHRGEIIINGGVFNAHALGTTTAAGVYATGVYAELYQTKYDARSADNKKQYYPVDEEGNKLADATQANYYPYRFGVHTIGGKVTVNGGTFNAKAFTTTAMGAYAYWSPAVRTDMIGWQGVARGEIVIHDGEFNSETETSTTAEGVRSYGTVYVDGGTFNATSKGTTAYGVRVMDGTTTVDGGTFNVTAGTNTAIGVRTECSYSTTYGYCGTGEAIINGGTFNVNTWAGSTAYGVNVTGTTGAFSATSATGYTGTKPTDYAYASNATINGGTFIMNPSDGTSSYGIVVEATKTRGSETAYPKCEVNGGFFQMKGNSNSVYACGTSATEDAEGNPNLAIKGGHFSTNVNLSQSGTKNPVRTPYNIIACVHPDYKATYPYEVAEAYTITFKDDEGGTLWSGLQPKGSTAVYPLNNGTPEKTATETNSFEFASWDTPLATITADATYIANFTAVAKKFMVTWKDDAGNEIDHMEYASGQTPTHADPDKEGYTFTGWTPAITAVGAADQVYTATFSINQYTIRWENEDGSLIREDKVNHGTMPTKPSNPTKEGYSFQAWNPGVVKATEDVTYTATYLLNLVTLTKANSTTATPYVTFASALTEANKADGGTLTLLQDVNVGGAAQSFTKTTTLDLNGHSLRGAVNKLINVNGSGKTVTAKDSKGGGMIEDVYATNGQLTAVYVTNGTFVLESGTIRVENPTTSSSASYYAAAVLVPSGKTFRMEGGTLESVVNVDYAYGVYNLGTTILNHGTINTYAPARSYGIRADNTTTINNDDVIINANATRTTYGVAVWNNVEGKTITINGGTFNGIATTSTGYAIHATTSTTEPTTFSTINVNGGKFKSTTKTVLNTSGATIHLNAGFYDKDMELAGFASPKKVVALTTEPEKAEGYNYKIVDNAHRITFQNEDGSVNLQQSYIEDGVQPVYHGEAQTKASTPKYSYTFDGWKDASDDQVYAENELPVVSQDAVYTAHFAQSGVEYPITFANIDGMGTDYVQMVAYDEVPVYDGPTPYMSGAVSNYAYTFIGWDPEPTAVTGAATYTPRYDLVISHNVSFVINNGSAVTPATLTVAEGAAVERPADQLISCQHIAGWYKDGALTDEWDFASDKLGESDLILYAKWETKTYTITWLDESGDEIDQTIVDCGTVPTHANLTKPSTAACSYEWKGWNKTLVAANADATYKSLGFTQVPKRYAITFVTGSGVTPIDPIEIEVGSAVTRPADPTRSGYIFTGWLPEVPTTMPANDVTCVAQWALIVATVEAGGVTTNHTTIEDAISTATGKTNPTVTMLQNASITSQIELTSPMTIDLNGKTITSTIATATTGTFLINTSAKSETVTICDNGTGGKIYQEVNCSGYLYGIHLTKGSLAIESGTIHIKNTANNRAYGIYTDGSASSITVSGSAVVKAESSASPFGLYSSAGNSLTMNGGTFIANGSGSRGIYMKGTTNLTNATITVSGSSKAYAIFAVSGDMTINSGTYTTTGANNNLCIFHRSNAITINGGYFSTPNKLYQRDTDGTYTGTITLKGGYYSNDIELAAKCATNHHVLSLPADDPNRPDYEYKVAEAYTVTFNANGHGTAPSSQLVEKGQLATAPTPPTADGYTFGGWYKESGCTNAWNFASDVVNANTDLYAKWTANPYAITYKDQGDAVFSGSNLASLPDTHTYGTATALVDGTKTDYTFDGWFINSECTGEPIASLGATAYTADITLYAKWTLAAEDSELDIVDWNSSSITINVTNLKTKDNKTNWAIRVNGVDYTKSNCNTTTRTLTVTGLSLKADENLLVQVKNGSGIVESYHNYTIPHLYNSANATLTEAKSSSVVYVYGGKLTISGNTTLAALYVCPGAEVEVTNGKLTVDKLVLRTKPWATAAISGNVEATNIYYTRIAPDGQDGYAYGQYYQFGLPYACAIDDVRLSDGTTPVYNTTWVLKSYNEQSRAEKGTTENNWDALAASGTIEAGRGYEMISTVKTYREYYFPVTPTDNTSVYVTRHGDNKDHSGWNIICSPLMSVYENTSNPVDGLKVSWLLTDGSYDQAWPETIWPALPFSYQASATGKLDFSKDNFGLQAPRRRVAEDETIQTEWLHLDARDANGTGDHTSIFVHPNRFLDTYETGIDVAKQSFEASRALIYSTHAYGEMAFAGVSDELLEKGIPLTLYSPAEQKLTISMRENRWLDRMAFVWLIDKETGARTDLLMNDYRFIAPQGTTTGRFFIQGQFFAPQVATDIQNTQSDDQPGNVARKLLIDQKIYIQVNGKLYDTTGKLVIDK